MGASRKVKSAGVDLNTAEKADEIPGGKQAGNRRETGGRQAKFGVERLDVSVSCFAHTHTYVYVFIQC